MYVCDVCIHPTLPLGSMLFQNPADSIWPKATIELCSLWKGMLLSRPFYSLRSHSLTPASFEIWTKTKVIVKENLTLSDLVNNFFCNKAWTRNAGLKLTFLPHATLAVLPPPLSSSQCCANRHKIKPNASTRTQRVSLIACTHCLLMDISPSPSFLFWHTGCSKLSSTNKSPQGCLFEGTHSQVNTLHKWAEIHEAA